MKKVIGINICNCAHGATVHKEFFEIVKETNKFYVLDNGCFGEIKVVKEKDNSWVNRNRREEVRDIYTKNAKLIDDDGEVISVIKDYYKRYWAEIVYEEEGK